MPNENDFSWHEIMPFRTVRFRPTGSYACCKQYSEMPLVMRAARDGRLDLLLDLLNAGADIDEQLPGGWNPLMEAAWQGREVVVNLLLNKGANVHARGTHAHVRTPLGKKVCVLDCAVNLNTRKMIKNEINRRLAAAVSVMPERMPESLCRHIIKLARECD